MLDTAMIRFDLPQGVYLTSDLGAVFGVPEPATIWLVASGLVGLLLLRNRFVLVQFRGL